MLKTKLRLGLSVMVTWAAALGALYLHPGLWGLFALLLSFFVYTYARQWRSD